MRKHEIFLVLVTSFLNSCRSTKDDPIIVPPNAQVIMHLNTPFPYIEIRDEHNILINKIDIYPDETNITIETKESEDANDSP